MLSRTAREESLNPHPIYAQPRAQFDNPLHRVLGQGPAGALAQESGAAILETRTDGLFLHQSPDQVQDPAIGLADVRASGGVAADLTIEGPISPTCSTRSGKNGP